MGVVRFADFDADLSTGELRRAGQQIRIQDLPFRLLAALVAQPGVLVSRADLGRALWGNDTFVDFEAGLNTAVAKLREALDDRAESPRFIETVPKRGYRFIGQVDAVPPAQVVTSAAASPISVQEMAAPVAPRGPRTRELVALLGACAVFAGLAVIALRAFAAPSRASVAVALFDNETDRRDLDRKAQTLTDATVLALTRNPALAVIGNASILRTERPFRDLLAIRDALHVDFVVIGQLQQIDGHVMVITHLIRTSDQVHLWVERTQMDAWSETAFEGAITDRVSAAMSRAIVTR